MNTYFAHYVVKNVNGQDGEGHIIADSDKSPVDVLKAFIKEIIKEAKCTRNQVVIRQFNVVR